MNTHTVTLSLTVSADTPADALDFGLEAGGCLRDSFDDITEGVLVNVDAVAVPRAVLAELSAVLLVCEAPLRLKDRAVDIVGVLRDLAGVPAHSFPADLGEAVVTAERSDADAEGWAVSAAGVPEHDETPEPEHRATYSPEDNKLRIYPAHRLDADTYARVKAAGFSWAPRQELFVAPMWTPGRADLARELCGEIGDEDTTLCERAEERADRFTDYSASRADDADQARAAVARIADGIPLGQPILVGHHSERHARKDAARIESGMRRAVDMWETASYWKARAAGAVRAAAHKERPDVRARRIKGIEADLRKVQRSAADATTATTAWETVAAAVKAGNAKARALALHIANFDHVSQCFALADFPRDPPASQYEGQMGLWSALTDGVITPDQAATIARRVHAAAIARAGRWISHYENRLTYERAMLAEGGGLVADRFDLQPGGIVDTMRGRRLVILRVNRKDGAAVSVTVTGQSWTVGVEEITAYVPPSDTAAAAVKAAMAKAPLCNYPSDGCATMTAAQWAGIYTDTKGTREVKATDTHAAHRRRYVPGYVGEKFGAPRGEQWGQTWVYISDAKRTDAPPIGGPVKPARKAAARKVASVDTGGTPGAPPAPAGTGASIGHAGRVFRVLADFPDTEEGTAQANAYMEANDGAAMLCTQDGRLYLAHRDDAGKPSLRQVVADLTAPSAADMRAEIERRQARVAANAEREAEAAPFDAMRQALRTGQAVQVVSAPQLFPTPADVAARMVELAQVGPGDRVLEPSAGTGALLRALPCVRPGGVVWAVEVSAALAQSLDTSGLADLIACRDFLTTPTTWTAELFDVVLMNPPFKDAADIAHILHARRFLAPGGRLVAICAAGPRQHEALQPLANSWEYLPPGTFAGTSVRAVLLTMGAA